MTDTPEPELAPDSEVDPEVEAWGAKLDELDAAVTAARDSGDPQALGDALVDAAAHLIEGFLTEEAVDLMIAARDAFSEVPDSGEHGPVEATECAFWAANLAMQIGDYPTALDGFSAAADEYRARGMLGEATESENNRGAAATQLGEFRLAEEWLNAAISGYRQLGLDAEIPGVRLNLANVYRLSGRQQLAESEYRELEPMFAPGSAEAAHCVASLAALYTETERVAEARVEYERALRMYAALGADDDIADTQLVLAHLDMLDGDPYAAIDRGQRARADFEASARPEKVAMCDFNLGNFHTMAGDYADADAAFERARVGLIECDLEHNLPTLEWSRFKRYLLESARPGADVPRLGRLALEAGTASVIGTDHQRYQFPDTYRRLRWRELLTTRVSQVFDAAFTLGDTELLADLIEMGINAGVYSTPQSDGAGAPEFDPGPAGPPTVPPNADPEDPEDPDGGALTMGAASLLATAELPLAPPPTLWTAAQGRQILGRYRDLAGERNPSLAALLRTRPGVVIW